MSAPYVMVSREDAHAIWVDVYRQLGEIADQTGCEAGARRAFHDGRFAALKELGLLGEDNAVASDDVVERRRRELRRAFHDGRFAALKELGLVPSEISADSDEVIERRRRELDEALRPGASGEQMAFEPIVRRYPDNMQRLVHHRPACSLRDPEAHGSAAMTCTCDYWLRSRVNITTPE